VTRDRFNRNDLECRDFGDVAERQPSVLMARAATSTEALWKSLALSRGLLIRGFCLEHLGFGLRAPGWPRGSQLLHEVLCAVEALGCFDAVALANCGFFDGGVVAGLGLGAVLHRDLG
jgi:hypothetical protein